MSTTEFQSRLLYTQKSVIMEAEEGNPIAMSSSVYAIRFLYPGATQHTTSRLRIACTYKDDEEGFEAHSGVIERWSDKGWIFVDDYIGEVFAFTSEEQFRKRLLDYSHAFIMGVPLTMIDNDYTHEETLQKNTTILPKKGRATTVRTSTTNEPSSTPKKKFDYQSLKKKDNYKKIEPKKSLDDSEDSDDDDDDFFL